MLLAAGAESDLSSQVKNLIFSHAIFSSLFRSTICGGGKCFPHGLPFISQKKTM